MIKGSKEEKQANFFQNLCFLSLSFKQLKKITESSKDQDNKVNGFSNLFQLMR